MQKENFKGFVPMIISIALFLVLIFTAGYAYYSAAIRTSNITSINTTLPQRTSFSTNSNDCVVNISEEFMAPNHKGEYLSSNCFLSVTVNGSKTAFCKYDVVLEETGDTTYVPSTGVGVAPNKYEFSATISGALNISETQINTLKANPLVTGKTITVATDGVATTQTYNILQKVYNLDLNQDNHATKSYSFRLKVENVIC